MGNNSHHFAALVESTGKVIKKVCKNKSTVLIMLSALIVAGGGTVGAVVLQSRNALPTVAAVSSSATSSSGIDNVFCTQKTSSVNHHYIIKMYEGHFGIFADDSSTPLKQLNGDIANLPKEDQELLAKGINASDMDKANQIIANFGFTDYESCAPASSKSSSGKTNKPSNNSKVSNQNCGKSGSTTSTSKPNPNPSPKIDTSSTASPSTDTNDASDKLLTEFDKTISGWLSKLPANASKVDKELCLHDNICGMLRHDYSYTNYDLDDVLSKKTAICEGYANVYVYALNKAGIEATKVTCTVNDGLNQDGSTFPVSPNHAMVAVKLDDGHWYYVDPTWDDDSYYVSHTYFNFTLNCPYVKNHRIIESSETRANGGQYEYSWFKSHGLFAASSNDISSVAATVTNRLNAGNTVEVCALAPNCLSQIYNIVEQNSLKDINTNYNPSAKDYVCIWKLSANPRNQSGRR